LLHVGRIGGHEYLLREMQKGLKLILGATPSVVNMSSISVCGTDTELPGGASAGLTPASVS
jgi:hypothetical protein